MRRWLALLVSVLPTAGCATLAGGVNLEGPEYSLEQPSRAWRNPMISNGWKSGFRGVVLILLRQ